MEKPTARFLISTVLLIITLHSYAQVEVIHGAELGEVKFLGTTGELMHKATNPLPSLDQNSNVRSTLVDPLLLIEGVDATQLPSTNLPDANGDVSPEHYVHLTNGGAGSVVQVFDKTGVSLYGPASLNVLWQSLNVSGQGEPIVLWDQGAERWLLSEKGAFGTNTLLVAVSKTADPLGDWNAYEIPTPEAATYPKYSVWANAYYLTTDESNGGSPNQSVVPVYLLDRAAMLNGESAVSFQRVGIPKFENVGENIFQVATPADWDGATSPPPADSPLLLLRMYDDDWAGGQDKLEIWEIEVDWNDENNTTITGPIELFTEPFKSNVCDANTINCLTQSNGYGVSPKTDILMHRVNYRNFGVHETLVLNHVVDADGNGLAAVKWYELRKTPGSSWQIYQEGLVSFDEHHRFMGSIAIDGAGNIGLGYSIMSEDKDLSLAFTGRKVDDPLGQMTLDEYEFASGASALNGFRVGDYAMMSVDESDGRTFWFTGEYMKANAAWGTKIAAFQVSKDSFDIGPHRILNPVDSPYLSDAETIVIQVKNFGLLQQSNFKVGVMLDGVFLADAMVTDIVQPDSIINVTIGGPINMTALGTYDFKVYTFLSNDENTYNDTLRSTVHREVKLDAAITGFTKIENLVCDTFAEIGIILTNIGPDTLWSTEVEWQYNSGPLMLYQWNGYLTAAESDTVSFLLNPLADGFNTITAETTKPNGLTDENSNNDFLEQSFQVESTGEKIALHLRTDLHPGETSWMLTDSFGAVLYQGGSYGIPYTEYIEELCLVEGCYTFTISDSWIDGLTAGDPDGLYYLSDENGKILATIMDTAFVTMEQNTFCIPFACALSSDAIALVETISTADDGAITLSASSGIPPYEYSIDGGNSFQSDPLFANLTGNIYNVVVRDVNGCTSSMAVQVHTCTLQFTVVATNATAGQEDGSIEINPEHGVPPFRFSINNGDSFHPYNIFTDLPLGNYMILVEDSLGCTSSYNVDINVMVGIEENRRRHTIEILPNPTPDFFRINVFGINDENTLDIELLDANGKVIKTHQLERINDVLTGTMSLEQMPSGVYYVLFKHKDIRRLSKVIKR